MFKKLLIPVDGSVSAEKLIAWAGSLAGTMEAEVILLAAADPVEWIPWPAAAAWDEGDPEQSVASGIDPYPTGPQRHSMSDFQDQAIKRAIENARKYLEQQAERLRLAGVKPTVEVREGSPIELIPKVVRETRAEMVVMSSRRTSALERGVLGSVTDRVMRMSSVPVLVVHPDYVNKVAGHNGKIESILVPLDGSELSELAVGPAIGLASQLGAKIVLVRVLESGLMQGEPDAEDRDQAAEYLSQFTESAESDGVVANTRILAGPAAKRILEESEEEPGTIVAMGTHGRGGFRRLLLGSVTDKVVRSAHVPILAVPPGPDQH